MDGTNALRSNKRQRSYCQGVRSLLGSNSRCISGYCLAQRTFDNMTSVYVLVVIFIVMAYVIGNI